MISEWIFEIDPIRYISYTKIKGGSKKRES